jgi:starch synthase (maltosyl-transferring)
MVQAKDAVILDRRGIPMHRKGQSNTMPPIQTVIIENVEPELDAGRYPIKREQGDTVRVCADIYMDGHGVLTAQLRHKKKERDVWTDGPMQRLQNERWGGAFTVSEIGRYQYTIQAYPDVYRSWLAESQKKQQADIDISSELLEGRRIIVEAANLAKRHDQTLFEDFLQRLDKCEDQGQALQILGGAAFLALMDRYPNKQLASEYDRCLEVVVDRIMSRYAAWYEMFPRSQGTVEGQSATFRDCEARLPDIKAMGFDVIYLPPIHPIGKTNRKGPNNSLVAGSDDPGSPYAIGSEQGGHKAVEPGLGTLSDFEHFVNRCREMGMEVALDFAINCSPDHPYVREHPDWFYKRPDGTIKYAENPPKKYEDIYPLNFYCGDREALWQEMKGIIEFWILHGVHIFRVDNPHTKPVVFWEWLIDDIQQEYPQVIFLSEAFTHPKMMRVLAKAGFTQSYTYFTWRNYKHELIEYFTELTQGPMREYFRGNLFTNTPDILPMALQEGGRPGFKIRVTLAATLSSAYGIYNGFELCENKAIPGREEYLNSEKYQFKVWDWNRPGNIKSYISTLNQIRQENPALQEYDNLDFLQADNDNIIAYQKSTLDKSNVIFVIVNLDSHHIHHSFVYVPIGAYGIPYDRSYELVDLVTGARYYWKGEQNYVQLDPHFEVAHILRLSRW